MKHLTIHSRNTKGSILIWTVFLGLFIAVFFSAFQSRLEQYFSQTKNTEDILQESLTLNESLEGLRQKPQVNISLSHSKNLEAIDFDGSNFSFTLPAETATEFRLTSTGGMSTITGKIVNGGPIKYISMDVSTMDITGSGEITDSGSINISTSPKQIIYIENLGSYARFTLSKGSSDLLPTKTHYKLVSKSGDFYEETENYSVQHFVAEKAFTEMQNRYNDFGMYLNVKKYD